MFPGAIRGRESAFIHPGIDQPAASPFPPRSSSGRSGTGSGTMPTQDISRGYYGFGVPVGDALFGNSNRMPAPSHQQQVTTNVPGAGAMQPAYLSGGVVVQPSAPRGAVYPSVGFHAPHFSGQKLGHSSSPSQGLPRITSGAELQRNPSLQFAMEFDEDCSPASPAPRTKAKLAIEQLWRLMACTTPVEHQMQKIVHDARDNASYSPDGLTSAALGKVFEEQGYEVCLRTALGGGQGVDCLHNLRHNFLLVRPPGKPGEASFIVDIEFQAQFQVAHATSTYQSLIDNMEGEFIGTEQKLRNVIQFVCEEMAHAFREKDVGLPPWRQTSSMMSKWCPRRSEDHMPDGRRVSTSQEVADGTYAAASETTEMSEVPHNTVVMSAMGVNEPRLPWE